MNIRAALLVGGLSLARGLATPAQTIPVADDAGARFDDVSLFGAVTHGWLDRDCDGGVAAEDLAGAFGMLADDPRTDARILEFDRDGDGVVDAADVAAGIRAGVEKQVDVTMLVDANEDGELSLAEHALGFPDRDGRPDENGVTPRQLESFRFFDRNSDRRVTRLEVTAQHERTFAVIYWASTVAHLVERIDADADGLVRLGELVRGLGLDSEDELSPEQRDWFRVLAGEDDGEPAIALRVFRIQLLQDRPVASRMAMERPIRALLAPACGARARDGGLEARAGWVRGSRDAEAETRIDEST